MAANIGDGPDRETKHPILLAGEDVLDCLSAILTQGELLEHKGGANPTNRPDRSQYMSVCKTLFTRVGASPGDISGCGNNIDGGNELMRMRKKQK
jgi:hypothetical protein